MGFAILRTPSEKQIVFYFNISSKFRLNSVLRCSCSLQLCLMLPSIIPIWRSNDRHKSQNKRCNFNRIFSEFFNLLSSLFANNNVASLQLYVIGFIILLNHIHNYFFSNHFFSMHIRIFNLALCNSIQ